MNLSEAKSKASKIVSIIKPYCSRVEVAGSIRRGKLNPRDVDIVAIGNPWLIRDALLRSGAVLLRAGDKIISGSLNQVDFDIYLCNEETWGVVLLSRTGPKSFNIKLALKAREHGFKLSFTRGLLSHGRVVASKTEEEIFRFLGLSYLPPSERG